MKKLLEILGTITIAGSGISGIVGNAPISVKNEINYLQTNNLEKLKRVKRQNNRPHKINEKLILNWNKENYKNSFNKIINELIKQNILDIIFESGSNNENLIFEINHNAPNFIISAFIDDETTIDLLFSANNLYLQGFMYGTIFYYFSDSTITSIDGQTSSDLQFNGNYPDLLPSSNPQITWENILQSFHDLASYGQGRLSPNNVETKIKLLKAALFRIILVTAETLRFRSINDLIINNIINQNLPIYWNPESNIRQTNIYSIVTNWQSISNNIIDSINNIQTRFGITGQSINEQFYNLLSIIPTHTIAQALANSDVRVILGLIMRPTLNCNRRRARNINNDIKNQYCDAIKDINQDYNLGNKKITVVKILEKNKYGQELTPGHLKAGDIYVGTTGGVYLIRDLYGSNRVEQFDDLLNFSIKNIVIDEKCNAYALSDKNDIFYLRYTQGLGWTASKIFLDNYKFPKNTNIINMKEILKNSDDGYLKAGDIYVQTDNGNYLIHNNQQTEKITTDKHYFIKHDDNTITTVHFNREDNSYCHSSGKKIAAVSTATVIGASAGSVIPGLGTLIGAGVGALVGGIGSIFITEEVCNHR